MINDVTPPRLQQRAKPKVIEPLAKTPGPSVHQLAANEDPEFHASLLGEQAMAGMQSDPEPTSSLHNTAGESDSATTQSGTYGSALASTQPSKKPKQPSGDRPWYKPGWPLTRLQYMVIGAVFLVAAGSITTWALVHHTATPVATAPHKKAVKKAVPPPPIYSTLTGLQITDESLNKKPVTAVMIENSLDARPQSGLGSAGVVFEAVAEGGVTRFVALFQDTTPTNVGPIRSARPYYIQWMMGFDAAYAHVGGSPDALNDIKSWGVKDMNQFSNGGSYHRITTRPAPHNVYTGIDTLNQLESQKGYTSTYTGFTRKKEAASKTPNATTIDFKLSGPTYDPHFAYNATTNSYDRSEAGEAHMDANSNTQISPKVVVAIVVPMARGALDASGAYYSDYNPIGSGTAYVFQDGVLTQGQWNKASNSGALTFTDSAGKPLPLNPGQTWISAVTSTAGVVYK
jgi:hypothetical protein